MLANIFEAYQESDLLPADWTFKPPFRPLVHRWGTLNDLHAEIRDDEDTTLEVKQAADTLVCFLEPILAPAVRALVKTRDTGKISYDNIWQIFPPSEFIVITTGGIPRLGRVLKYEREGSNWRIHFEKLAWDGSACGYVEEFARIKPFSSDRYVNSLDVYPVSFHQDPEGFRSAMLERGRKFERLRGYHTQTYKGSMYFIEDKFQTGKRPVSSPCCYLFLAMICELGSSDSSFRLRVVSLSTHLHTTRPLATKGPACDQWSLSMGRNPGPELLPGLILGPAHGLTVKIHTGPRVLITHPSPTNTFKMRPRALRNTSPVTSSRYLRTRKTIVALTCGAGTKIFRRLRVSSA